MAKLIVICGSKFVSVGGVMQEDIDNKCRKYVKICLIVFLMFMLSKVQANSDLWLNLNNIYSHTCLFLLPLIAYC